MHTQLFGYRERDYEAHSIRKKNEYELTNLNIPLYMKSIAIENVRPSSTINDIICFKPSKRSI